MANEIDSPSSREPGRSVAERLEGLDSLRAYAACAIVVFHMVYAANVPLPTGLGLARNYLGFGVPLFFVVSAFSLSFGYMERLHDLRDIGVFYVRRFARIAPMFYAMLCFQLLLVFFAYRMTKSAPELFASLTFTFNLIPNYVEGIVPASWSIGVEMIFYLLFPVIIVFARRITGAGAVLVICLFVAGTSYLDFSAAKDLSPSFVSHGFLAEVPYFGFGIAFYHAYVYLRRVPARLKFLTALALTLTGTLLIMLLIGSSPLYAFFGNRGLRVLWDSLWSVPFGMICTALALHPLSLLSNVVTRYLGKISFSLYLLHPPIVYYSGQWGVYRAIYRAISFSPMLAFLTSVVLTTAAVAGVASITYKLIERPGMRLGRSVSQRMRDKAISRQW